MNERLQTWRSEESDRQWLSRLVATMDEVSRPELRAVPCNSYLLAAVKIQLGRPASAFAHYGSAFSLRN
jgi:hypothetical protein